MTLLSKKSFLWAKLSFYVLVPVVLLALPSDFFDDGPPMCLSMVFFHIECYACGLTRGIMHLIHFDFPSAAYYNMLSFVVFPLLAGLWTKWAWDTAKALKLF